jgi:EF-P beta-lysylation protein EpmB
MIPLSASTLKTESWQRQLADAFNRVEDLLAYLDLSDHQEPSMKAASRSFGFRVTRFFASLMEKGNPDDPLLRQVLPMAAELEDTPGFSTDPLEDQAAHQGNGLLRKYHGRALLITTGACAINCRYCFRRHFPYTEHLASPARWHSLLRQLRNDVDISEVILSGGDPLSLGNSRLGALIEQLQLIPHLKRLRIHSRLPVVLPQRLDHGLTEILDGCRLPTSLVLHINHPGEISTELAQALMPLRRQGVILLNQAVLLRGVNDSAKIQIRLAEDLFQAGVLPYYLHQLDRVRGAAHFAVEDERATTLHQAMQTRLPGYLLPRLVREIPGARSKLALPLSQNE